MLALEIEVFSGLLRRYGITYLWYHLREKYHYSRRRTAYLIWVAGSVPR